MKDLVYSRSSQVTPDKDTSNAGAKPKFNTASILSVATGAVAAFSILDKTELKQIAKSVLNVVKVPWIAAGIIAAYVLLGVSDDARME